MKKAFFVFVLALLLFGSCANAGFAEDFLNGLGRINGLFVLVFGGQPNLIVGEIRVIPPSPYINQPARVEVDVNNVGKAGTRLNFSVKVFAGDSNYPVSAPKIFFVRGLPAGSGITLAVDNLSFQKPGSRYSETVNAVVDEENSVAESEEADNQGSRTVIVRERLPDLAIGNIKTKPAVPKNRVPFDLFVEVKNTSEAAFVQDFNVKVESLLVQNGQEIKTIKNGIGANGSRIVVFRDLRGPSGSQRLVAAADNSNMVRENSERNNSKSVDIFISQPPRAELPDLKVLAIDTVPAKPIKDMDFSIVTSIQNASNNSVNYDFNTVFSAAGLLSPSMQIVIVHGLKAWETKKISFSGIRAGAAGYNLRALVDSSNAVDESNKFNNLMVRQIIVLQN